MCGKTTSSYINVQFIIKVQGKTHEMYLVTNVVHFTLTSFHFIWSVMRYVPFAHLQ
jgi:hypothetical protein